MCNHLPQALTHAVDRIDVVVNDEAAGLLALVDGVLGVIAVQAHLVATLQCDRLT